MSSARLAILTILATLVLGAWDSSTALAHEFIVNGAAISKGETVEVRGSGAIAMEASIAKTSTHIVCGEGLLPAGTSNVLAEAGKFKSKIEFKACALDIVSSGVEEDQPKCQVANFNLEGTGELIEAGIASVSGGASKALAKIAISEVTGAGACALAGTFELKGTTACEIPDYLVTSPDIVLGCDPLGNKEIKLGSESTKLDLALEIQGAKGQTFSSN